MALLPSEQRADLLIRLREEGMPGSRELVEPLLRDVKKGQEAAPADAPIGRGSGPSAGE